MKRRLLPFLLPLIFLLVGIFTLSDYGMNWDAPIRMVRGQAYIHLFTTGRKTYGEPDRISPFLLKPGEYGERFNFLEIPGGVGRLVELPERPLPRLEFEQAQEILGQRYSFYQHEAWNGQAAIAVYDEPGHFPLADNLAALTNKIFWGRLGMLGDIESYQVFYLLVSSLGVFLVTLFAYQITHSHFASLVAGLSFALYPLFITEAHINMKDPLQATFFTGAIWSFWHWVKGDKWGRLGVLGWWGVFVLFVALALGVKWNIVFLPFILIPWLFLIRKTEQFKAWFRLGRLGLLGGVGGLGILLFLVAIWPYAWADPLGRIWEVVKYYLDIGVETGSQGQGSSLLFLGFNIYPLLLLLFQTPEIILVLGGMGVIGIIRGIKGEIKVGSLLLLWFLVVLLRQILPNMRFYMGLRQLMEIVPALALISGIGTAALLQGRNKQVALIIKIGIMILFVILFIRVIQLHPNENAYFNFLVGGLQGAQQKNLIDWKLTYGNIYKQAAWWLNEHAEENANLALIDGSMYALSPLWLRQDISISPYHFSGFGKKGEYILSLLNPENPPVFAYRYPIRFLNPISAIKVDGVALVSIYKNDQAALKKGFAQEKSWENPPVKVVKSISGDFIEIDLGQEVKVTRIILDQASAQCRLSSNKRFIDSFVDFVPEADLSLDTSQVLDPYSLLESQVIGDMKMEFSFAAEPARLIRIFPQNPFSCFFKGRLESVKYLDPSYE